MPASWPRAILHLDLDAFYVAVHLLDHPTDRDRPLAVGAPPGSRGVVMSASYEAREFGVRSAMPSSQAVRRCPELKFVWPDWPRIEACSREVMTLLATYGPLQPVSIDEACVDLTGQAEPEALAQRIRDAVESETGLPASVGLATTRLVAKVASDRGKPQGCLIVPPGSEAVFLAPLPVRVLWGVGPKTAAALADLGIDTCGALAQADVQALLPRFGHRAGPLQRLAHGDDARGVRAGPWRAKQVSAERTFARDLTAPDELDAALAELCEEVGGRLRASGRTARTVVLKLRWPDFTTRTRQRTVPGELARGDDLLRVARELWREHWPAGQPVRLMGVSARRLAAAGRSLAAFDEAGEAAKTPARRPVRSWRGQQRLELEFG